MNDDDVERFLSLIEPGENEDDCWKWLNGKDKDGYGIFYCNWKSFKVHRLSFEIFNNRKIKEGMSILHSCDNPECSNPKHLREGTQQENVNDMILRNRQTWNKLTENQVKEIRERYSNGEKNHQKLANEFNVSRRNINWIVNNKSWKHLK